MSSQSTREDELSTTLYRLIGDLNAGVSLLPTRRTIERWSRREVFTAVIRCKDLMVEAQKRAIQLSRLDAIDVYSANWIDEIVARCDEYQDFLTFVEDELVNDAC